MPTRSADPFLIWVGDTHTDPRRGLVPKYAIRDKGQQLLHDNFSDVVRRVKQIGRTHNVITCLGGDLVDLPHDAESVDLAVDALMPLVNTSSQLFGVYGTPYHVGEDGKEDRSVYGQLGATMPRKNARGHHWLSVANQLVSWAHHGLGVSDDPARELDSSFALARKFRNLHFMRGYPRATAIVRHHRHLVPLDDLDAYGAKVRMVGCWKLPDSYGHQKSPGILPDITALAYWPREHRFETWRYPLKHEITRIG